MIWVAVIYLVILLTVFAVTAYQMSNEKTAATHHRHRHHRKP